MYAYKINKSINQYQGFLFTNLLHVPQLGTWEHSSLSMFGEYTFLLYLSSPMAHFTQSIVIMSQRLRKVQQLVHNHRGRGCLFLCVMFSRP